MSHAPHPRGEFELIAALRERLGDSAPAPGVHVGSGDDAAVLELGGAAVVSVDAVVEGVHFRRSTFPLRNVGHKALAAALSDLAAMGAEPVAAFVQLGVPHELSDAECLEIAAGIAAVGRAHGVRVAGGDLSASPVLFLAVTVLGSTASAASAVTRSGARPGDVVAVTGRLGGAGAGLRLLEDPPLGARLPARVASALRARQLEPAPRLAAGRALAAAGATAMIDLSDGLGADAAHVAAASGVALRIELERLPLAEGVAEVASTLGEDPLELASGGGEDYELLATLPGDAVAVARRALGSALELTEIGEVVAGDGVALSRAGDEARPPSGFDHRSSRR